MALIPLIIYDADTCYLIYFFSFNFMANKCLLLG